MEPAVIPFADFEALFRSTHLEAGEEGSWLRQWIQLVELSPDVPVFMVCGEEREIKMARIELESEAASLKRLRKTCRAYSRGGRTFR